MSTVTVDMFLCSPVCLSFMSGTSSIPSPLMMSLCSTSVLTLISSISFLISSASLCFVSYCRFLGSAEPHQPWSYRTVACIASPLSPS